jgi:hypothetical protein
MDKYKINKALEGKSNNTIMTEQAYREKSSRYFSVGPRMYMVS